MQKNKIVCLPARGRIYESAVEDTAVDMLDVYEEEIAAILSTPLDPACLSQYQQRAEIGRLAFTERWGGSSLQEDLLQVPAMIAYSKSLGVNPALWEFDLRHYAEEPDLIGAPVFCEDQCRAPFTFRYEHISGKNLVITGIIYVDDNQSALIGTLACSSTEEQSCRARRLVAAGIHPDTLETVSYAMAKLRHKLEKVFTCIT